MKKTMKSTVDVHIVPLMGKSQGMGGTEGCRQLLNSEEINRANHYRVDRAREEFIVSRAALRCLLAGYLGCHPTALDFQLGDHGKPELAGVGREAGWQFNLSHSRGMAAIAVTRTGRVGVDIESDHSFARPHTLAKTILSERELQHYLNLSQVEQVAFLQRSWTLKESLLKGMGVGLSVCPREVEFSFDGEHMPTLLATGTPEESPASWRCMLPKVASEHTLALATDPTASEVCLIAHKAHAWRSAWQPAKFA